MTNTYFNTAEYGAGVAEKNIQDSIEYNNHITPTLLKICQPLFDETSNISVFEYSKFYKDGTFYHLCTHPEWHETYLKNFSKSLLLLEHVKIIIDEKRNFHVWDINHTEHISDAEHLRFIDARRNLSIWGDYAIYTHDDESVECWRFSSGKKSNSNINSYINNINTFECFMVYFKGQAADIIDNVNAKKITIADKDFFSKPNKDSSVKKEKREKYLEKIRLKKYTLETPKGPIELSLRETQCLGYRSKGLSDKEIAEKIINRETNKNITVGTVHVYFDKIKQKSRGQTMAQLRNLFSNSTLANLPLGDL
jgi:hypothetical protein